MSSYLYISILALLALVYTYIAYPLILFVWCKCRKAKQSTINHLADLPDVSLVIAAWNEEKFIVEKLGNSLDLQYPREKLHIVVVTDGSTDGTMELVNRFEQVTLYHSTERKGKTAAINRIMPFISTPITIFTDANTCLNPEAVHQLVRHFADPKVACVAGEKRIRQHNDASTSSGEGLYWKYESFLKKADAQLYSTTGAAGELFAIRTNAFTAIPEDTILDDFVLSLQLIPKGYKIAYEPNAYAIENATQNIKEEWKRKVRIASGGFQAMLRMIELLNFWKRPLFCFQYVSHRVFRWTIAPLALITCFVFSCLEAISGEMMGVVLCFLQLFLYALVLVAWLIEQKRRAPRWCYLPFYFTMMHLAVIVGFFKYLFSKNNHLWKKAERYDEKTSLIENIVSK